MRVFLISGDFPPSISGVGDYSFHVARNLALSSGKVDVVTSDLGGGQKLDLVDSIHCHRCVKFWGFREVKKIIKRIPKNRKACVINIQYNSPRFYKRNLMINFLPLFLRLFRPSAKVVVTMHGFWEQSWLYRLRTIPMLRLSHGVIYVDNKNRFQLERFSGKSGKQLKFIPIASNIMPIHSSPSLRNEWRTDLGLDSDDILVAFFGGIGKRKGLDYLIEAINILISEKNAPVKLIIIGGFNNHPVNVEYQNHIRCMIQDYGLDENIIIIDEPDAKYVSQCMHASDLAVFPFITGVSENSGSMLAALAHGLPTIVTGGGTLDDRKFSDQYGVFVASSYDKNVLADIIIETITSDHKRKVMKERSLAMSKRLDWKYVATETDIFFRMISGTDSRSQKCM